MMRVRFLNAPNAELVAGFIGGMLQGYLAAGKRVLWLVSGGSTIPVAVLAQQQVAVDAPDSLTIMQIDERYGPVGHSDSNWKQLQDAGLALEDGQAIPVLTGADLETTVGKYEKALSQQLAAADVCVGLFGMGADGHTAGILPNSPAVTAKGLVAQFQGPDFTRITITGAAIARLDCAVLFAAGRAKAPQLQRLRAENAPPAEQPAQLLKQAGRLLVYSDTL